MGACSSALWTQAFVPVRTDVSPEGIGKAEFLFRAVGSLPPDRNIRQIVRRPSKNEGSADRG
jgi:hypothetical protein